MAAIPGANHDNIPASEPNRENSSKTFEDVRRTGLEAAVKNCGPERAPAFHEERAFTACGFREKEVGTTRDAVILLTAFSEELLEKFGNRIRKVILYGSYARGEQTAGSDIDVMVLVDTPREEISEIQSSIWETAYDCGMDHGVEINPTVQNVSFFEYWSNGYPFYSNVAKDGIVVYER